MGRCRQVLCVITTILSLGIGLGLIFGAVPIVKLIIKDMLPIVNPGSEIFEAWQDPGTHADVFRHFYFYEIKNPDEVFYDRAIPDYRTIGPFVFRERQSNPLEDVYWAPNTSIGFTYKTDLHFHEELSIDQFTGEQLSLNRSVTNLNMALISAAYRVGKIPDSLDVDFILNKETVCLLFQNMSSEGWPFGDTGYFTTRTVHELMFGYIDPILHQLNEVAAAIDYQVPTKFHYVWNGSQPAPSPYDLRHGQKCPIWDDHSVCNQSLKGPNFQWSGADWGANDDIVLPPNATSADRAHFTGGLDKAGVFTTWANNTELWWWGEDPACRRIKGGGGMLYHMEMTKDDKPTIFVDDIFRDVTLEYSHETSYKGIDGLRYHLSQEDILGKKKCYNQDYVGVFNLSEPTFAPTLVTSPFFLNVDPDQKLKHPVYPMANDERRILNVTFNGVPFLSYANPRREDLEIFAEIFPLAGNLLTGAARLQTNTWMAPLTLPGCPLNFSLHIPGIPLTNPFKQMEPRQVVKDGRNVTEYFPETLAPLFIIDRHAVLNEKGVNFIKNHILLPIHLMWGFGGALVGATLIWIGIVAFCYLRQRRARLATRAAEYQQVE